eukprot:5589725-Prymnesium_polylepis.2
MGNCGLRDLASQQCVCCFVCSFRVVSGDRYRYSHQCVCVTRQPAGGTEDTSPFRSSDSLGAKPAPPSAHPGGRFPAFAPAAS